jgi:hypothetical protein
LIISNTASDLEGPRRVPLDTNELFEMSLSLKEFIVVFPRF